ncbi:hypothetical protein D9M71_428260 [compost metagenome]
MQALCGLGKRTVLNGGEKVVELLQSHKQIHHRLLSQNDTVPQYREAGRIRDAGNLSDRFIHYWMTAIVPLG